MPTKYPELFAELSRPFPPEVIKTLAKGGRTFRYVTSRTLENRLDEVLGPENWYVHYINGDRSIECHLTFVLPGGERVTKVDAGGCANMSDEGDDEKSGYSDAFKRACKAWTVGRELWNDGNARFYVDVATSPQASTSVPATATTQPSQAQTPAQKTIERGAAGTFNNDRLPTTGKSLWAWLKSLEEQHKPDEWCKSLSYRVSNYLKSTGAKDKLEEWTPDDVKRAITHVGTLRDSSPEELEERASKRRSSAKRKGIEFDRDNNRVTPLGLSESASEAEVQACEDALQAVASKIRKPAAAIAHAIVRELSPTRAEYLADTDPVQQDWDTIIKCVTLLRIWWPDECKDAISKWMKTS